MEKEAARPVEAKEAARPFETTVRPVDETARPVNETARPVETAVAARAGFLGRPMLVVLCVSTIVAALALGAIWIGMSFFGSGAV